MKLFSIRKITPWEMVVGPAGTLGKMAPAASSSMKYSSRSPNIALATMEGDTVLTLIPDGPRKSATAVDTPSTAVFDGP